MQQFRKSSYRSRATGGFTLLEVLLAIAIFAICMTAIYTAFRTSARAFENGRRSAEQMQTVRFTLEQVTRDVRGVYYETDYNGRFYDLERFASQNMDKVMEQLQSQSGKSGSKLTSEGLSVPSGDVGSRLNLQFKGEGGADANSIEFAHFLPSDGTNDNSFLGTERVKYYLSGSDFYRQRSRVLEVMQLNPNLLGDMEKSKKKDVRMGGKKTEEADSAAQIEQVLRGVTQLPYMRPRNDVQFYVPVEENPLPPELMAKNVTRFDVKYGYFFGEWKEADSWDSESKEHRTPSFKIDPKDPNYLNKLLAYETRPPDALPSYVRISMTMGAQEESSKNKRTTTVSTVVWLPSASEVYVPTDDSYFSPDQAESGSSGSRQGSNSPMVENMGRETQY